MWGQPPSAVRRAKLDSFSTPPPPPFRLLATVLRPGTFSASLPYLKSEDAMRAYLANLTPKTRMLLALPALAIAYTLVTCVLPALVRAVVPDVVRSVLSLL
jgi:hypothetical protein